MQTIDYKAIQELSAVEHERIQEIVQPYYADVTQLLARALSHNTHIYLSYHDNLLVAFFMVAWETLPVNGTIKPALFLGLSGADPDYRNSKLASTLYKQSMLDIAQWQLMNDQQLIVWFTTATPIVWHSINRIFKIIQPTFEANCPPELAAVGRAIQQCHYPHARPHPNPFVLKNVATGTQYTPTERTYLAQSGQKHGPSIFEQLGIDESAGDRLLVLCTLPDEALPEHGKDELAQESMNNHKSFINS